jgi:GDP/UDP-N,N'-diacetylbacillosamine 2-epimerase (hydrolysing)
MDELLTALDRLNDTTLIFTMPNADTGGRTLSTMVQEFVQGNSKAQVYTSLGQHRYISCLEQIDGVVGNSSSGLAEAPSFKIGTVNIGDRQKGRLKGSSVIDCEPDNEAISEALDTLYSADFQAKLDAASNPYGNGGASKAIVRVLAEYQLENICKKSFYNLSESHIS